jgi:hypothetical protein
MNSITKILAQKAEMVPESGHNLAGLDDFGKPDEQGLYLIANFTTLEEAQVEKASREHKNPGQRYYIYSAR